MTANELLGLLRREDGRRLVEDEDVGLAVQRLEDLDALLDADREVLDDGVGVDLEAVARSEIALIRVARPRPVEPSRAGPSVSTPSMTFSVTVKTGHQHEVLVDHADAGRDRVARAAELHRRRRR